MAQVAPDGPVDERFVDFVYQPMIDAAGAVTGIFVEGYDVTERVRAEIHRRALVELGDRIRGISEPDDLSFAAAEILGKTLEVSRAGYGTVDKAAETITIVRDWNAPGIEEHRRCAALSRLRLVHREPEARRNRRHRRCRQRPADGGDGGHAQGDQRAAPSSTCR